MRKCRYVLGQHALHSVLGAQNGPDSTIPMIGVTLKHWIGNNVEGGVGHFSRMSIDANISACAALRSAPLVIAQDESWLYKHGTNYES